MLEVISGVELTAEMDDLEIHLLGYFVDESSEELQKELKRLQKVRIQRIYDITEKLRNLGLDISADDVFGGTKSTSIGRLHIARTLVEKGLVSNIYEVFAKYIGNNRPEPIPLQ